MSGGPELRFEEIEVSEGSAQAGKSIRDLKIRQATGAMIVALRKQDGTFDTTPTPDAVLGVGDLMIAAGPPDELRRLEAVVPPPKDRSSLVDTPVRHAAFEARSRTPTALTDERTAPP